VKQADPMQETLNSTLPRAADLAALVALNDDYILAVESSDARRFAEILADDFVCSMSDGTQATREAFLEHVAEPSTISNLQAHDVQIRLMALSPSSTPGRRSERCTDETAAAATLTSGRVAMDGGSRARRRSPDDQRKPSGSCESVAELRQPCQTA
jgi:Domain of unknown function (DUF4440)